MSNFKYLFPIAVISKEELLKLGRVVPKDVEFFEVRVRDKDNPLQLPKEEAFRARIWEAEGYKVELI